LVDLIIVSIQAFLRRLVNEACFVFFVKTILEIWLCVHFLTVFSFLMPAEEKLTKEYDFANTNIASIRKKTIIPLCFLISDI
jgi:hypothetical protein